MYLEHFRLTEPPFTLTPDTEFFFNDGSHQEALNVLMVALAEGGGFIKVTGEVGTGKTLLCRKLLNMLGDDFVTAYIPNPFLTPTALRMALADELEIEYARNIGQHRLLKLISARLVELNAGGQQVVLLLDEAQAIPDDTLEALRLLTNLETEKRKLMQVVMFGQPELDVRLASRKHRQLKQRVVFSYQLQPLSRSALHEYVQHRLRVAGYAGSALLSNSAIRYLHHCSRGIPRLVNILCHKSMLAAYGAGKTGVTLSHVRRAANDTEDIASHTPRWLAIGSGIAGLIALTGAGLLYGYPL